MEERGEAFQAVEKKFVKRIDKITKLYSKSRQGVPIDEDLFAEMLKFVRDEKELRASLNAWLKEVSPLRASMIAAEYSLMGELKQVIDNFKSHASEVYYSKGRKQYFSEQLKPEILEQFRYENLVAPTDTDYLLGVFNFLRGKNEMFLKEEQY